MIDIYREIRRRTTCGETVALATVVSARGSTPRAPGAKMVMASDGSTVGTVGGGWGELRVQVAALAAIRDGQPRLVHVELTESCAAEDGAICGGILEVFVEPVKPGGR